MKKTEYFMTQVTYNVWQQGLTDVKAQRDTFINANKQIIGKIDSEDIVVTFIGAANQINIVIKLSFYNK